MSYISEDVFLWRVEGGLRTPFLWKRVRSPRCTVWEGITGPSRSEGASRLSATCHSPHDDSKERCMSHFFGMAARCALGPSGAAHGNVQPSLRSRTPCGVLIPHHCVVGRSLKGALPVQ